MSNHLRLYTILHTPIPLYEMWCREMVKEVYYGKTKSSIRVCDARC